MYKIFQICPSGTLRSWICKNLMSENILSIKSLLQSRLPKPFANPCTNMNTSVLHA